MPASRFVSPTATRSTTPADRTTASCFEMRAHPDGVYDQLEYALCTRPLDCLGSGELSINHNYRLIGRPPARPGNWRRSTANRMTREEEELRFSMLGEFCGKSWGSRVSSMGNFSHGISEDGIAKTINDGTSVRNKIVMRLPSNATETIEAAWDNQVSEIKDFEVDVVNKNGSLGNSVIMTAPDSSTELIAVAMPQIYKDLRRRGPVTKKSVSVSAPKTKQKVSISSMKKAKEEAVRDASSKPAPSPSSSRAAGSSSAPTKTADDNADAPSGPTNPTPVIPTEWDQDAPVDGRAPCALGATYSVNSLPDHRGPVFQHVHSVVDQPEVYNVDGNLVHPRDLPYYLKPGVLLLLEGKFVVWHVPEGHSLVQFIADAIKIIGDSDEPPQLPEANTGLGTDTVRKERAPEKRTAAFLNFGKPPSAKRTKVEDVSPSVSTINTADDKPLPTEACASSSESELTDDDADGEDEMDVEEPARATRSTKGKGRAA